MAATNFTKTTIQRQLAQRSGQIALTGRDGGFQFIDELTNTPLSGAPVDSSLLAVPQSVNDPRITSRALDLARGFFAGKNVPPQLVEAIASVAAYTSVVQGVPVASLISNQGLSNDLIRAYNNLKPKSSQVGYITANTGPAWANNPVLRGSVRAALIDVS